MPKRNKATSEGRLTIRNKKARILVEEIIRLDDRSTDITSAVLNALVSYRDNIKHSTPNYFNNFINEMADSDLQDALSRLDGMEQTSEAVMLRVWIVDELRKRGTQQ